MSDTEKNTPVLPEVEAEIRMESNSITDNSIGESEQLVKSEHDLFGTEGEPGNQNASGNSGSGRLWPGFYPQHPFGQGLPVVVFNDDTLRTSLTTWSAQVLAAAHNGLDAHRRVYRLGSAMARVDVSDGSGEARSELLDKDGVWGVLARSARWARVKQVERANGKKSYQLHEVNAPGKHLLDLMSWPEVQLPRLRGIADCPMVLSNGDIVGTHEGYDPQSEYWFSGVEIPKLPDVPAAKTVLNDWLVDFPVDESGKANAIGMLIGNLIRPLLRQRSQVAYPGIVFDASSVGSGKTLLALACGIVLTGAEPYLGTAPSIKEEWHKNITSWAASGARVIIYDNLPQKGVLDSADLAAVLTTGKWTDRLLGKSRQLELDVSAQIILTGNNVNLSEELGRRMMWVRLVPSVDRPWVRTAGAFQHPNILRYTQEHRAEILGALLALIKHWFEIGQPIGTETMGSYEQYAGVIGGVLGAAGITGWLANSDKASEQLDQDRVVWLAVLKVWHEEFGENATTAGALYDILTHDGESDIPWFTAPGDDGRRRQLGARLRGKVDAVIGPWCVRAAGVARTGVPRYRLEAAQNPAGIPYDMPF